MWVIEDHLRPSGHIMPDHAGDRGAELLFMEPHDHLHVNQSRTSATGMSGRPQQSAARVRWNLAEIQGPASESSRSAFVLLNNARRDAPALADRDALVFRPRPDAAAALAA